jgi:MFS family permease
MAIGEGLARRSGKTVVLGFIGCALAGAVFGVLAGWAGQSVHQYAKLPNQPTIDLEGTVVVQMTMLAVLCGGIGLALGTLTARAGSAFTHLLGGVLAGVFAGMVYPIAAAYLLPTAQTEHVIPRGTGATLLWFGLTAVLLGLVVPEMKLRRTRPKAPTAPEPSAPPEVIPENVSK